MRAINLDRVPTAAMYVPRDESLDDKLARLDAILNAIENEGWTSDLEFSIQSRRKHVAAVLKTLDGCRRIITVSYPPQFEIRIPYALTSGCNSICSEGLDPLNIPVEFGVRRYFLKGMEHDALKRRHRALYEEQL